MPAARTAVVLGAFAVVGLVGAVGLGACATDASMHDAEPAMTVSPGSTALTVTLVPSLPTTATGQPLLMQMQVHNPTAHTQRFCTYHTLFEGLRNDIFAVDNGGDVIAYAGMMAKRGPPHPADFRDVAPGATIVSNAVDITDGYPLVAGRFTIMFSGNAPSGLGASSAVVVERRAP